MGSSAPCGGDCFTPYGDAPLIRADCRTCEICGNASKEAAEAAWRAIYGPAEPRLPGPYGKCLGPFGTDLSVEIKGGNHA